MSVGKYNQDERKILHKMKLRVDRMKYYRSKFVESEIEWFNLYDEVKHKYKITRFLV